MTLSVIGVGVGRTGTYSLKLALNQLGLGPCHHMEEVLYNLPTQVPLWSAALDGRPEWSVIYEGYRSAVDWPTACFYRELHAEFPEARFVLTHRGPEKWADSFGGTIYKLLSEQDNAPPEMRSWLEMASGVVGKTGFAPGLDYDGLLGAFRGHREAVRRTIPSNQMLEFDVKEGWEPLCEFLDMPIPDEPFPRSNHREEFWDRVNGEL